MSECKTKTIKTDLGTFRHNQTYPGISPAYSGIFRTLCYPDIFKTVVYPELETYSEPWYIHIPGTFRTLVYLERWHIENARHIQNPVKHLR